MISYQKLKFRNNGASYMEANLYAEQTVGIMNKLSVPALMHLWKYAKFLEADERGSDIFFDDEVEMTDDVALYDAAMADDDGYRISGDELRAKYGL